MASKRSERAKISEEKRYSHCHFQQISCLKINYGCDKIHWGCSGVRSLLQSVESKLLIHSRKFTSKYNHKYIQKHFGR